MNAPLWLVTGAGSGVGRVLAVALAAAGAQVLLTSRDPQRLRDTAGWCGPNASLLPADLANPASVESLARGVQETLSGRPLAGMVHAAGLMAWDSPATASPWSLLPLVNAISPWRLTQLLEDNLLAGEGSRVLFVAGAPFTLSGVRPDLDGWRGRQAGRGLRLALEAASAKVWMARSLHRRWKDRASAFAFHPGFVKSNLAEGLPFPLSTLGCLAQGLLSTRSLSGEFAALDPAAAALSGGLIDGRRAVADCPTRVDPSAEDSFLLKLS